MNKIIVMCPLKKKKTIAEDVEAPPELQGPLTYTYKELNFATTNFSEQNKLGEGGFGEVYKVNIFNVAIMKLFLYYCK